MDLDRTRLEDVAKTIRQLYGDVGDLPVELVNTLANIHWKAAERLAGNPDDASRVMRPLMEAMGPGDNFEKAFMEASRQQVHLLSALKYGPELVKNMREVRREKPELFPDLCELTIDILKYDIEDAANKSPEQRRRERAKRPVAEIPNLGIAMGLIEECATAADAVPDWITRTPTAPDITAAAPVDKFPPSNSRSEVPTGRVDGESRSLRTWLVVAYFGAIAIATLIVPWKIDWRNNSYATEISRGYSFVWKEPAIAATIDYSKVFLEYVAISCGFGIAWVVLIRRH